MKKPQHHQCQGQSPHTKQKGNCAMTAPESHKPTVVELFDTEQHIEIEHQKFARLQELAELIVDECGPLWENGDGNGSYVIHVLRQKFNAAGYGVAGQGGAHPRPYEIMGDSFES